MSLLPRAHTHPPTRPLTALSALSPAPKPHPHPRTALPSPTAASRSTSSSLRAIPRGALASPRGDREQDDPFCVAGFFGPGPLTGASGGEGEFNWVREPGTAGEPDEDEARDEGKLDGEDELGMDECVRRVLSREDRMGVLALTSTNLQLIPGLSRSPTASASGSPPTPPRFAAPPPSSYTRANAYTSYSRAYGNPDTHPDLYIDTDSALLPAAEPDTGPETDDGLHASFAARTRAVSYPDLVMLARKRKPAPPALAPVPSGTPSTVGHGRPPAALGPGRRAGPRQVRAQTLHVHQERAREPSAERTELAIAGGGLFFDLPAAVLQKEKKGVAGVGLAGLGETGAREGWRVWALERAGRVVGLE